MNPAYWIAFGPHGPRALPPPGQNWFIFWSVMGITGVCCVVFFIIRLFARGPPSTMTREWQEATNEYLRVRPHPRFRLPPLKKNYFSIFILQKPNSFLGPSMIYFQPVSIFFFFSFMFNVYVQLYDFARLSSRPFPFPSNA